MLEVILDTTIKPRTLMEAADVLKAATDFVKKVINNLREERKEEKVV